MYGLRKFDHVTSQLRELHWLRVPERITSFRLAVLAYRCQHGLAPPPYLADELHRAADAGSRYQLRSASTMQLIVPTTIHSTTGDRAFPVHEQPSSVGDVIAVISYLSETSGDGTFRTLFWPRLSLICRFYYYYYKL